jgi:hypothetical protein
MNKGIGHVRLHATKAEKSSEFSQQGCASGAKAINEAS